MRLEVFPNVYPPGEDSALLARYVDSLDLREKVVLDVGCGSGIISVTAAKRGAKVWAVDINPEAVENTKYNAERNGVGDRVTALVSDLYSSLPPMRFDYIFANPPYLDEEPDEDPLSFSWAGGRNGRETLDAIIEGAPEFLKRCGKLVFVQTDHNGWEVTRKRLIVNGMRGRIVGRMRLFFEELLLVEAGRPCL